MRSPAGRRAPGRFAGPDHGWTITNYMTPALVPHFEEIAKYPNKEPAERGSILHDSNGEPTVLSYFCQIGRCVRHAFATPDQGRDARAYFAARQSSSRASRGAAHAIGFEIDQRPAVRIPGWDSNSGHELDIGTHG